MAVDLSAAWLEDEEIEEEEETVYGGNSESPYIQGYGAYDVIITMAKRITSDKSDTEFIEIDFKNKEGKEHRERFMVRGKDGKPFFIDKQTKKKKAHFGVNKIKSLIAVCGLYGESKTYMKELYSNTEEADVTWTEYGKEKTEEFTVFTDLLKKKVKICLTSKKVNATTSAEQDDEAEQKYVDQCVKDTKKYCIANPKKKSLKKFVDSKQSKEYPNVYKWFTESTISHFATLDGSFKAEVESGETKMLTKFLEANDEGLIFEGRTLIPDDMDDKALAKLGINKYGKRVEPESDDDYVEPEESEAEEEDDEDWG